MNKLYIIPIIILVSIFSSCDNIFSPRLDDSPTSSILSDQTTIDGVFQNFKYAYTFKDTSVYSNLLTDDFVFTYRDYEQGFDISWDKPTEMKTTAGLFRNAQKLEVIWNNITVQTGDTINMNIKRSFNLTITFNPSNVIRLYGFADMNLLRSPADSKWRIKKWRDESF